MKEGRSRSRGRRPGAARRSSRKGRHGRRLQGPQPARRQPRRRSARAHDARRRSCAQLGCVWSTQLVADDRFSPARAREPAGHGTGHITRIGGVDRPAARRERRASPTPSSAFSSSETRLGIPAIIHEESTRRLLARDATQFPQAIGLASTWNPALIEAMAAVIREQMLAVGARQTLAPVLDIARDPRWGRTEETYGEDPYLAARLGVAYVRGLQGDDLRHGVAATGKHFLGYGAVRGRHEPRPGAPRRRASCARSTPRPFEAAIREAGLASMMNAYNEIDGLPCAGAAAILDDLLRGALGFDGVVVADYFTPPPAARLPSRRRRQGRGGAPGAGGRARRRAAGARLLRRAAARRGRGRHAAAGAGRPRRARACCA